MTLRLPLLFVLVAGCGADPLGPLQKPTSGEGAAADTADAASEARDTGLLAPDTPSDTPAGALLSPEAWVTRASLDLRGIRPSLEELAQATDDTAAALLVDSFVDDPRFGHRMAWVFNDVLHTAVWFDNSPFRFFPEMTTETGRAAGFAPLAMVEHIAANDRPWTDLVTATQVPHNDRVAELFSVPGTGTGDTWTLAPAWDDRPMAGILSSTTLWLAYDGDRTNFNRRRANEFSRIFLCADFLAREVTFQFQLSPEALAELERAVQTEPACGTCHAVLDPLASYFGGFVERSANEPTHQLALYSDWTAEWYRGWAEPAYYGRPGKDLTDLGAYLAADPRFTRCAVENFAGGLVSAELVDDRLLDRVHADFAADGLTVRAMVRSIVHSDAYRSDSQRVLTTEQVATSVADLVGWGGAADEDLTHLIWEAEYRLLGGGTDDSAILVRNPDPNVGHVVLMTWVARRVVDDTLTVELGRDAGARRLFTVVAPDDTTVSSADVRAQLVALHTRMLSQPVATDAIEVDELVDLFEAAGGTADPLSGWAVVLHALIRHPAAVLY